MNISDALDSYLTAKMRTGKWEEEFNKKFYGPIGKALVSMAMQNARTSPNIDQDKLEQRLSPEAKRKFRGE